MVGHQWFNNSNSGSISVTSAKQDQEKSLPCLGTRPKVIRHRLCPVVGLSSLCLLLLVTCVALSVLHNNESGSKPKWKSLLFDYQNMSDTYLSLTAANKDLRRDNELLKEQSAWLHEQTKSLNRTSANLMSGNIALSLESSHFKEQIVNLTSTNSQQAEEHLRLVQYTSDLKGNKLNMSQTITLLMDSNTQQEEEGHRLFQMNSLLREELTQLKGNTQEILEINNNFEREVKNLSEQIGALMNNDCEKASKDNMQLLNQNLSTVLIKEKQEAAMQDEMERMMADMHSINEAFHSLDLYCPVANHDTKERICKKCQESWRLFETKCYYISSRRLTWSSSRDWCQTQAGDLLIINSEPEQSFVSESSKSLEPSSSRLWMGLTDAEEEGVWRWVDGSLVTSDEQYWLSREGLETEPDDWKLEDPLGENCGHMDISEDKLHSWMDGSCKTPYRWICEKNV
ncbi:CD209 antigen-like isoform X2 [Gymnodraco acuticeps]|nr:CD209 antigen-like isoform X2 [Gymnodraco acuticeps]